MFSYEEIQKYNETDMRIYKYIVSHIDTLQYMTIRELAKELQVSTSTILRFCNKNNFDGYSEFKEALKEEITLQAACPPMEDLQELSDFFTRANSSAFEEKLLFAVDVLRKADNLYRNGFIRNAGKIRSKIFFQYGAFCRRAGRCILSDRDISGRNISMEEYSRNSVVGKRGNRQAHRGGQPV